MLAVHLLALAVLLPAASATASPIPGDRLFARLSAERRDPRVQEVFDFTLAVYSRGLTMGREISLHTPESPGLNHFPFQDRGTRREVFEGRTFSVHRFLGRAQAVAPGTFVIRPVVRAAIVVPAPGGAGRPETGAAGRAEIRQAEFAPGPLTVEIRPLPESGKPQGFNGAVGSFTFSASARPAVLTEGAPVTLTMEISGRGNIAAVAAPPVRAGDGFKVYEPKVRTKEIDDDLVHGRLVFEQTLIPRAAGAASLPAVEFSYFDPARQSYRTLVSGPFPLSVAPPPQSRAAAGPSAPAPETLSRAPVAGIAPLKPEPPAWPASPARSRPPAGWLPALLLAPPAILAALFLGARRRDALARDAGKARRRLAPAAAREGIRAADAALRRGDPARFHDAVWESLCAYFGHRLNLLPGEISGEEVVGRLSSAGLSPEELARLGGIFRICERERFRPPPAVAAPCTAQERQELSRLLDELGRLLQACEKVSR